MIEADAKSGERKGNTIGCVSIKRVYGPADQGDGYRVLVDRLWPRGVRKDKAQLDTWIKDIAPSIELRRWFADDSVRCDEFERRYRAELAEPARRRAGGLCRGRAAHARLWSPRYPP